MRVDELDRHVSLLPIWRVQHPSVHLHSTASTQHQTVSRTGQGVEEGADLSNASRANGSLVESESISPVRSEGFVESVSGGAPGVGLRVVRPKMKGGNGGRGTMTLS
jgi:hypothetical protein